MPPGTSCPASPHVLQDCTVWCPSGHQRHEGLQARSCTAQVPVRTGARRQCCPARAMAEPHPIQQAERACKSRAHKCCCLPGSAPMPSSPPSSSAARKSSVRTKGGEQSGTTQHALLGIRRLRQTETKHCGGAEMSLHEQVTGEPMRKAACVPCALVSALAQQPKSVVPR